MRVRVVLAVGAILAGLNIGAGCPLFPQPAPGGPTIGLELVADELTAPVALTHAGDGSGRLFIVEQIGRIRVINADGTMRATPFLDLRDRLATLNPIVEERGLIGLAFHPQYESNGRFFVFYSPSAAAVARISEFSVSDNDANRADATSERIILDIPQPQDNHNGGQLAFGPDDGYLYISTGDGGGANDIGNGHTATIGNAQDRTNLLGNILRINVDGATPFEIPADNPFVDDDDVRDEIYAYGLRNPWRFSFDQEDGETRIFAGDVGQGAWEEVDLIESGGNYGWFIREGANCLDPLGTAPDGCLTGFDGEPLIEPIIQYPHDTNQAISGISVIGGFVYRGAALSDFAGKYIFGDFSSNFLSPAGKLFVATESDAGWTTEELAIANRTGNRLNLFLFAFGTDEQNELYVLASQSAGPTGTGGFVYRIVPADN